MRHTYSPGKVDYNKSGRKNCRAAFTWEFDGERFSMQAEIWNPRGTDIYCGGQCVDTVAAYFPHNKKVQRMLAIWREWHLNDMQAGSPAQRAELKKHDFAASGASSHFLWAQLILHDAGLEPDPGYTHNGKPYRYGSAWLTKPIPPEVVAEIEGWSADHEGEG